MTKNQIVADGLERDREANGDLKPRNDELRAQLVNIWEEKLADAPFFVKPFLRYRMRLELADFDNDAQNLYLAAPS